MALLVGALFVLLGSTYAIPSCRFALEWSQDQILARPDDFVSDMLYWEGQFHQNDAAYNEVNGMTYDGTQIDWETGEKTQKHPFSAASKEAIQIMLYAKAMDGSAEAARFLSPNDTLNAPQLAFDIMEKKLATYLNFNETYPGFGGALPWFASSSERIAPQPDWENRVPALDNGELWWAVYAWIHALQQSGNKRFTSQANAWQDWLDFIIPNMIHIFYRGKGTICAVTTIADQTKPVHHPNQTYKCEGDGVLNDPYEGELVAYFFHLFGNLSSAEKAAIWEVKRPQLVKDEYKMGGVGPITVEKGYWFSGHETWKVLELPFFDVDIIRRVHHNGERARTCNSVVTKNPGLFASVNNVTDPATDTIVSYISPAGIPSIANQTDQYLEVITPYATWPSMIFDKAVGLAWWHNMVSARKMQNPYGSTESTRIDGKGVSALLTWDSKVLTVVSLLGGVSDLVREKMKADGIYDEFIYVAQREYSMVFGKNLKGEHIKMCLPQHTVATNGLEDFSQCSS